ncbi:MliC family protein [Pseudomaricurvus sp.]|uniref:MliC family protein n=1 Tax=Pseudomaricurvus sp. TaxID=2004510 RepID=UPI003F6C9817
MSKHTTPLPLATLSFVKPLLTVLSLCGLLMLSGCASNNTDSSGAQTGSVDSEQTFDANSWKTVIPKTCQRFTDGCNNCVRNLESGVAACTRKACVSYSKPECLDGVISGSANAEPKKVVYQCESNKRLEVSYGQYVQNDKTVELQAGQIILRDPQSGTAHLLNRVRSASGERYQGDGLEFWSKGSDAMLRRNGQPVYLGCISQS